MKPILCDLSMTKSLSTSHLLDIPSLSDSDIRAIFDLAKIYEEQSTYPQVLQNQVIVSAFFEPSTRTRISFAIAAERLGARVVVWDPEQSSLLKGESFADTMRYLAATRPDALILRHADYGAPTWIAGQVDFPIVNAGDSYRAHPTQALLDAYTMIAHKGTLKGLNVAICGDITHSRVAADNIALLTRFGAQVHLLGPESLLPTKVPETVRLFTSFKDGLKGCDIVMMLRLQKERMAQTPFQTDAEYFQAWGLTAERLAYAKPEALVMHPGPMNRGVEISDEVADHPRRSVIFDQPTHGVFVRMAVLDLLLNPARKGTL